MVRQEALAHPDAEVTRSAAACDAAYTPAKQQSVAF